MSSITANRPLLVAATKGKGLVVATFAEDTFTRTGGPPMGVSDSGHTWSNNFANWSCDGDEAVAPVGVNGGEQLSVGQSDCYVEATYSVVDNECGISFRCDTTGSTTDGMFLIQLGGVGATTLLLRKYVGAAATNLGSFTCAPIANGDRIAVRLTGSNIKCFLNEVMVGEVTETDNQFRTRHGLQSFGGSTGAGRITYFRITS